MKQANKCHSNIVTARMIVLVSLALFKKVVRTQIFGQ